jgi:hypothetical protein
MTANTSDMDIYRIEKITTREDLEHVLQRMWDIGWVLVSNNYFPAANESDGHYEAVFISRALSARAGPLSG